MGYGLAVSRSSTICPFIDTHGTLSSPHTCRTWQSRVASYFGGLAGDTCLAGPLPILWPDLRTRHDKLWRRVQGCERQTCMYDFTSKLKGLVWIALICYSDISKSKNEGLVLRDNSIGIGWRRRKRAWQLQPEAPTCLFDHQLFA